MEMEAAWGNYGDHEQTNSISSSSGTIVSTQTTYTSRASLLSSFSIEAAMHLDLEESKEEEGGGGTAKGWRMKILLQEFLRVPPPSANCSSIKDGGILDLERWFIELGVAWLLHLNLADGGCKTPSWIQALAEVTVSKTPSWIQALDEVTETIRFTASLFPDHPTQGLTSIFEDEEKEPEANNGHSFPDQFNQQEPEAEYYFSDQFNDIESFMQESMSKMLSFVDIVVALDPNNSTTCESFVDIVVALDPNNSTTCESFVDNEIGVPTIYNRIKIALSVHNALSKALSKIRLVFHSAPASSQVERMTGAIVRILSAKETKAFVAIWSTMEQIRMGFNSLTSSQDSEAEGSSDIHTATRSVMGYIVFLQARCKSMAPIVSQASRLGKYVPQSRQVPPLISLVIEMVSSLQEKLANKSESFQDQALRFLFLLNNANMMRKYLINYHFAHKVLETVFKSKIKSYMESYLQLSWAPLLPCLLNPKPRFFGRKRKSSPLSKFESEFQKVYNTQKLWKVPDPQLRERLRKAIIEKIIPGYTKYIEDYKSFITTTPKFSPQVLEAVLQEIFEG